jgi:hypothetical protein
MSFDIVFCVLNYNRQFETIKNIKHNLSKLSNYELKYTFHVIDNGSYEFEDLSKFCRTKNLYFTRIDVNYGITSALNLSVNKFFNKTKFFIRIDNDVFINNSNDLSNLLEFMINNKVSICGPRIIDRNNNFQSGQIIIDKFLNSDKRFDSNVPVKTDTVLGCCIIFNFMNLLLNDVKFSEKLMFGCEELEITLRNISNNNLVYYYPHCTFKHEEGLTTQRSKKNSNFTNYLLIRNNEVVRRKYSTTIENIIRISYFFLYHSLRGLIYRDTLFLKAFIHGLFFNSITKNEWKKLTK